MERGALKFAPAGAHPQLVAAPVHRALGNLEPGAVLASAIDPDLADTAAFCEHYKIAPDQGANCVIVQAQRGDRTWLAAVLVLGSDRLDVNSAVRKALGAKKVSFAPMDLAVELTGMEYGGITPIGLPESWPLLVDSAVAAAEHLVIGSGIRGSKILTTGALLASLPGAEVLPLAKEQDK